MRKSVLFACVACLGWGMTGRPDSINESANTGELAEPVITAIQLEGTNVVVRAQVPAGITRVTLEGCRRLGAGAWTPTAVSRVNGVGGEITFRLARSPDLELLRVRADAREALPGAFYQGPTSFPGQRVDGASISAAGAVDAKGGAGGVVAFNSIDTPSSPGGQVETRAVVESDIWKVSGDTLYFFNQYRGLQVIDISRPDAPLIRGTLPLSAAGEAMYLLDDTHVVLLARAGRQSCDWSNGAQSQLLMVEIRAGKPEITATLPIQGTIQESRLVGTALYAASAAYREVADTNLVKRGQWESGTLISSFDLNRPDQPAARSSEWVTGNGSVVTATDRFLFVALQQAADASGGPAIRVFDVSAPDGTLAELPAIRPIGQVKDKFKMNVEQDIFTVVSEQWVGTLTTYVETFSLKNPAAPEKLGALKLIQGESLFATRFDGNRLYVVTFLRVDPLWVIDLSDPTQPKVTGELQVPGWSVYIHPLGDRLVTVGRENQNGWRTTLSLFDVGDPAKPGLLSRVVLGEPDFGNVNGFDEKSLSVFPDAGLILVPSSKSTTNGSSPGVQLVDLSRDALALRGRIEHPVQALRATLHQDRILSLSGRELVSVDATDRDHPQIRSRTELSWPVDQIFLAGQYLLEIDRDWANSTGPRVSLVLSEDPNQILNQLTLTNLPLLGTTMHGDHLYIAQGRPAQVNWEWFAADQTSRPVSTNWGVFSLAVLDLSQLPAVTVSGQVQNATADTDLWGNWEGLWPKPGLLVWKSTSYDWRGGRGYPIPLISVRSWAVDGLTTGAIFAPPTQPTAALDTGIQAPISRAIDFSTGVSVFAPWFWNASPGRLVAFDVSDSAAPQFASDINVASDNYTTAAGRGFAGDSLVYLSHRESESRTTGTNYYTYTNRVIEIVTNVVTVTNVVRVPQYTSVTNYETLTNITRVAVLNRSLGTSTDQWPDSSSPSGILACGGRHSLLVGPQKTVWTCGANGFGQLGDGTNSDADSHMDLVPGFDGVKALAAGYLHSLALKSDGTVWAWGGNSFGQLGSGSPLQLPGPPPMPDPGTTTPVQTVGLSDMVSVATGAYHSLALNADGVVWAWGANLYGQLGDGTTNDQPLPKAVLGLSNVRALAGGAFHSLAVRTDGTVWAWGRNDFGQLGNDSTPVSLQPGQVSGLTGARAVAGGSRHSLALKSDGSVWGWGGNDAGQLGAGVVKAATQPAPILGLDQVVGLAVGVAHNLALKSDGTVWAWGSDDSGQLGDGIKPDRSTPAPVNGLSEAVAVAAGGNFSLALTRDGTLWAWGDDGYSQLGDGQPWAITNYIPTTNISVIVSYSTVTNFYLKTNYAQVARQVVATQEWPIVEWFEHQYLDVVDYAVPTDPTVRKPVSIPGELQGVAFDGALLYTVGQRPLSDASTAPGSWLDATAYDGVEAHLVDSLALPDQWPHPVLVQGTTVFLGRPAPDTNSASQLEAWTLPETGKFTKLAAAPLKQPAQYLAAFENLIAVQNSDDVQLFGTANDSVMTWIGSSDSAGCLGFNLENAAGSAAAGLWLPLGDFGVRHIGLTQSPGNP